MGISLKSFGPIESNKYSNALRRFLAYIDGNCVYINENFLNKINYLFIDLRLRSKQNWIHHEIYFRAKKTHSD